MIEDTPASNARRVVVVGAGPAGLMAAETVAARGHAVTIVERMPSAGRKFLMAGRGGLNLTHTEPLDQFLGRYGAARDRLEPAIRAFPPTDLVRWAEGLGQETFVGTSGRVFPKAMKASPLLRAWLARLVSQGVEIRLRHRLLDRRQDGTLILSDATDTKVELACDALILALGGASWPRLGSDGGWAAWLRGQGVEVSPLQAANSGIAIAWSRGLIDQHAGAPLKRIAVTCGGEARRGEATITEKGLEGGVIYALSPVLRDAITRGGVAELSLDLRPDVDTDALAARLASARKGDTRANLLRKAARLTPAAIAVLRDAVANALPHDPAALAAQIKAVPLLATALADLATAISTAGGVAWSELSHSYMLERMPGVFCAGEMLDWEAPTGGYLLQASFATGRAAGLGALSYLAATNSHAFLA